jgi:hypothetical protein
MIPESDEHLMRRAILGLAPKAGQTYSQYVKGRGRIVWTVMDVNATRIAVMYSAGEAVMGRGYWLIWLKGKKRLT